MSRLNNFTIQKPSTLLTVTIPNDDLWQAIHEIAGAEEHSIISKEDLPDDDKILAWYGETETEVWVSEIKELINAVNEAMEKSNADVVRFV